MAYQKTTWVDDTAPYLNAVNLNNLEVGLESASAKADTNENNIGVNAGNISANTTKINANTTDIGDIKQENEEQQIKIDNNSFNITQNTDKINKNTDDISALSSGEYLQGAFTPVNGFEYPTQDIIGYSWYISGVDNNGYLYLTGDLAGLTAHNMDKIMYTSNGWSLIQNDLTISIENKTIGNLNNTLFNMPLSNTLSLKDGVGNQEFTRASTATFIDRYGMQKTAEIDEPRYGKEGILIEPESTNTTPYSEDFSQWNLNGDCSVSQDGTLSSDGITQLWKVSSADFSLAVNYIYKTTQIVDTSQMATVSFEVKAESGGNVKFRTVLYGGTTRDFQVIFDMDTETFTDTGANYYTYKEFEKLSNGGYRVSCTLQLNGVGSTTLRNGIGCSSSTQTEFYVNFGQAETNIAHGTSYIPTLDVPITRAPDRLYSDFYNNFGGFSNPFTIAFDIGKAKVEIGKTYFILTNGVTTNGYISINSNSELTCRALDGVTAHFSINDLLDDNNRIVFTSDGTEINVYLNGILKDTGTVGLEIEVAEGIFIGTDKGGGLQVNTNLKNLKIYDSGLTSAEARLA